MASLIVHGDRNLAAPQLRRRIHFIPVMGDEDKFSNDHLIVDVIYEAVVGMVDGEQPSAPEVLLVNLSLGSARRQFQGQLSAWARLIDYLSHRYGILFLVSAGNITKSISLPTFKSTIEFEDCVPKRRASGVLSGVDAEKADRRLFSPAETVNGLTIGAANLDRVSLARYNVNPYEEMVMSNPSSALGPGFVGAVKPDVLMPGAQERLRAVRPDSNVQAHIVAPSIRAGLKVAAPPIGSKENAEGYTGATSAACALASRTCHLIHDALEDAYGVQFSELSKIQRAVLIKALLVHTAKWPDATAEFIRQTVGPSDPKLHVRQKDNIRRYLGFGIVDSAKAIACTADRATFWACGQVEMNMTTVVEVPVPRAFGSKAKPHSFSATLAWMTPTKPGHQRYRSVRLKLLDPTELAALGVKAGGNQPDTNQTNRGTVFTRRWDGDRAAAVGDETSIKLTIQRDPDQGVVVDEPICFGIAVTLEMPGEIEIYEQVKQRLAVKARVEG